MVHNKKTDSLKRPEGKATTTGAMAAAARMNLNATESLI
jgi:hypothetical protein